MIAFDSGEVTKLRIKISTLRAALPLSLIRLFNPHKHADISAPKLSTAPRKVVDGLRQQHSLPPAKRSLITDE